MDSTPPGWLPNQPTSVNPGVEKNLNDITDHEETKQEYIEKIKEQLQKA